VSEKLLSVKRCALQSGIIPSSQHCKLDTMHDDHIFVLDRLYRCERRVAVCLRMLLPS
jgi:hypothetical protein